MKDKIRRPFVMGEREMKLSGNPETAERLRQQRVPAYYTRCPYRAVTAMPWDHMTEETPMFVECKHPDFSKQNYGECLGQCASAGQQYGVDANKK